MMGFHMNQDGFLTFGYGQRYAKYDLMGREVFNRRLPTGYADFSHALDPAQNGHLFLRVSSSDYRRPDGKRVHTESLSFSYSTSEVTGLYQSWPRSLPYSQIC